MPAAEADIKEELQGENFEKAPSPLAALLQRKGLKKSGEWKLYQKEGKEAGRKWEEKIKLPDKAPKKS